MEANWKAYILVYLTYVMEDLDVSYHEEQVGDKLLEGHYQQERSRIEAKKDKIKTKAE